MSGYLGGGRMIYNTREQWLEEAANLLYNDIIAVHGNMKKGERWQVTCGWPSSRALSTKHRRLGECWHPEACADKSTHHIFVTPAIDDPFRVLDTLLHELVHAVVGGKCGHKGPFRTLALAVGLEPPMTCTVPGKKLAKRLNALAKHLGPYPHKQITGERIHKQSTRLIKVVAVKCCQYVARTTRTWLEDEGLPKCPHGSTMEVA